MYQHTYGAFKVLSIFIRKEIRLKKTKIGNLRQRWYTSVNPTNKEAEAGGS